MSRHLGWRLFAVIVVLGTAAALALTRPARLGLDLRGGTQIVLEASDTARQKVDRDTVDRTLEVLRRRVDQLGVTEPTLQRSGDRRVIVELPGVYDPAEAVKVIGRTAQLAFHPVLSTLVGGQKAAAGELVLADEQGARLRLGSAALSGGVVGDARAELDPQVISSPQVDPSVRCGQGISGGTTVITGDFTDKEARDLALLIRAGALPVPVQVVEQRTVGPTLGAEAIAASTQAAIIGVSLTIAYMALYYRLMGGLSALALLCYGLLSFAVLLALRSTLTLPGIAGFVLAIGMAVDANVLVFERMKEEFRAGAGVRGALRRGSRNALSAIADSNVTTLLAALLLFFLASGAVRGFGVTLSVGVVVSMFTALVVTRVLVEVALRWRAVSERPRLLGVATGGRLRDWLATRQPNLLGRARWWLAGSALVLLVAAAGLVVRGPNLGLEFTGGRLLEYSTQHPVDPDAARSALAGSGFARAVVQKTGGGNVAVRSGQLDDAGERRVQRAIESVGGSAERVRSEFIGPTIGAELRRKAIIAVGIALAAQLAYMAIRFRWTFGTAAVIAMFHDVAILLGLFAWRGKPLDTLVNDACLQTVPRTVNTGLGAMFILVALVVLGGDTLTDFALALLVGILVGTYSSVFVAAPLVVRLERGRAGTLRAGGAGMPARQPTAALAGSAEPQQAAPGPAVTASGGRATARRPDGPEAVPVSTPARPTRPRPPAPRKRRRHQGKRKRPR